MKDCNKCGKKKYDNEFGKNKNTCKECKNSYERERRSKNREKYRAEGKEYYQKKKSEHIIIDKNIKKTCTVCKKEKDGHMFYVKTIGTLRSECKECASMKRKKHYQQNREKIIKQTSAYTENRKKTDISFKLERNIRTRLYQAFTSQYLNKRQSTMKYVNCRPIFFKNWIEFQLYDGMTMENYGEIWHIDHCKPCCKFDFSIDDDVYKCFHWSNMRPYLSQKNLSKHSSYNPFDSVMQDIKAHVFLKSQFNI